MSKLTYKRLGDIADVQISSIDKKTNENEIPVTLCNFVDVYYNWAITKNKIERFMKASVTDKEYTDFVLKKGDVAITKDSETREDIGISTYIADDLNNTCLGYHCALIKPHENEIRGKYLNALLSTDYARKIFSYQASGSGQRYTLAKESIENIKLPIPSLAEQIKIGNFISNLDRKIEINNKVIDTLSRLAKEIYDYWFVQYDFPDDKGRPYKSSGGRMVWNNELKAEIPEGWTVSDLTNKIKVIRGVSYSPKDELLEKTDNSVYLLKSNNIDNGAINYDKPVILDKTLINDDQFLTKGSIFITMSSGSKEHMGKTAIVYFDMNYAFGAFCSKIEIEPKFKNYLSLFFRSELFRKYIEKVTSGTSINNIGNEHLTNKKLPFPPIELQQKFENLTDLYFEKIAQIIKESDKINSLKNYILPLLMNGQVSI